MKRNPVIPYLLIAVFGILTVIVLSFVGLNQRDDIQQAEEGGEAAENGEGETSEDPEEIYESNCAACHGADLGGANGPDLTQVGSEYSAEEIATIIQEGIGNMPAQAHLSPEETEILSEWLSENQ